MARTGEHAPQSFTGFDRLADRAVAWLAERRREAREAEAARRAETPPPLYPRGRWEAMSTEARAGLWDAYDSATSAALGSPSIMTYGAAAARLGNAGRFAAMSRRGAGDAAIRRATRYERGPFGYGVETVGDATLRPAAVFGAVREGSLGDLAYIHPEVARAYPTMKDARVEMVPSAEWADRLAAAKAASAEAGGAGSTGAYAKATDTILVKGPSETEPLHMFADRADRTLVHEMQHAAQARDGLLGKAAGDYRTAAKEVDARNSANRRWLGPAERREMPRMNTQDVRPEEVHMDDRGGDAFEGFARWLESMPAARIDVPEERTRLAAMEDQRRRDRVANMYADIRLHEFERQARAREDHALALAKRDAAFAAQRDASERASAAARPGPADRARRERADYVKQIGADQLGTIYTNPVTGPVFIGVDGVARPASQSQMEEARRSRHLDDKGGDNFGTFRNFLATDEVPETLFGFPVVQDNSQYTEKDLEFFRKNPKAAGFYEMGDEEDVESQEANGAGDTTDTTVVSRLTEPDFDADSMAEQAAKELMSPRQALEMFYGSEVDRIMSEAEQARRSAALKRGLPEPDPIFDHDLRRVSVVPLHEDANEISRSSTLSSRMEAYGKPGAGEGPLDGAVVKPPLFGRVRSYASPLDGAAVVYKGREDAWAHELLGHVLNPYQVTSKEQDRFGSESKFYHFGNYAETAAALGNLRKALFKKSAGKVDIADPAELKKVVGEYKTNKGAFSGKWLPKDARAFLEAANAPHPANILGNELLDKRIRATWEVMQDEKSLKQFVKTRRNDQNGLA